LFIKGGALDYGAHQGDLMVEGLTLVIVHSKTALHTPQDKHTASNTLHSVGRPYLEHGGAPQRQAGGAPHPRSRSTVHLCCHPVSTSSSRCSKQASWLQTAAAAGDHPRTSCSGLFGAGRLWRTISRIILCYSPAHPSTKLLCCTHLSAYCACAAADESCWVAISQSQAEAAATDAAMLPRSPSQRGRWLPADLHGWMRTDWTSFIPYSRLLFKLAAAPFKSFSRRSGKFAGNCVSADGRFV